MGKEIGLLGYALLGMLAQSPKSGYDLRKQFTETPMSTFSDSPGSIYPALHRLCQGGLIVETSPQTQTGRRRQVFRLTSGGLDELKRWLRKPATREEVERSLGELMLRFALSGEVLGPSGAIEFLRGFSQELDQYSDSLKSYYETVKHYMSLSGRLALLNGVEGYACHARWAQKALAEFELSYDKSQ